MNDPHRFAIFGFFGGWNSGDEALFESVRELLLKKYPDAEIVVICTRVRVSYASRYKAIGVRVIPAKSFDEIKGILRTHRLVIGGGQIITGDKSYKGLGFLYWLTRTARRLNQPAQLIGIGVEGVHRRTAKWLCRRIVANTQSVGCRDHYSHQMLRSAGCDESKLRLTADVVLSKILTFPERGSDEMGNAIAIGLHHSPLRSYAGEESYRKLVSNLRASMPDRPIVLVSNDAREKFDAGLLDRLAKQIADPMVKSQHFETMDEVIDTYASAACVVSVRMHPLILGLIHGRPVVGIPRSNKVKQLAARVGFTLCDPDQVNPQTLTDTINDAIESGVPDLKDLPERAMANFDW